MDFIYMRTFIEVARCQSFTKAAEQLGYAQSSVTTQIQKLENDYGVTLFERYGRIMRLTSAGEQLLTYVERMLSLYEESKHEIASQSKGNLQIGVIESLLAFFLPPVISRFRSSFPQIFLTMNPTDEAEIIDGVKKGALDLGVILDRPCQEDDIIAVTIREEEMEFVASPDHPLAQRESMELADFNLQSLVTTGQGCTYRAALIKLLDQSKIRYELGFELGSLESIKQMVRLGLGIALLPRIAAAQDIQEGRLAALPFRHPELRFYTQAIYHKKKWLSPALRRFLELLQQHSSASMLTKAAPR